METSAKTGQNVEEAFRTLASHLLQDRHPLPRPHLPQDTHPKVCLNECEQHPKSDQCC